MPYRADIDGLRGIAVMAVVLYHAFPASVRSGFVGVDVFFVVSGFLITGIVLDDLENARFRFTHFYARRIRRLFPALIVVLLCAFAAASVYLLEDEWRQFGKHVAGASAFVSNFVLLHEVGYFDKDATTKPLLHLWSLGIEEQFYLAWPLVVWGLWRRPRLLLGAVIVLAVVSFVAEVLRMDVNPGAAFFSPVTRFWELLSGVLLAVWTRGGGAVAIAAGGHRINTIVAGAGLAAILSSCVLIGPSDPFPGYWALLPVTGTALVIVSGPDTWVHRWILGDRALVWVGLISYSLYLWHWPLLTFAHLLGHDAASARGWMVAASVVLAWLTWRLVERPVRFGKSWPRLRIAALASAILAIGVMGHLAYKGRLDSPGSRQLRAYAADRAWTYLDARRMKPVVFGPGDFEGAEKLRKDLAVHFKALAFRTIESRRPLKTLYVGDSHMEMYWGRIERVIDEDPARARTAVFLTASTFLPIPAVHASERDPQLEGLARAAINYALSDAQIDTVVFSAIWNSHLAESAPTGSHYFVVVDGKPQRVGHGTRANQLAYASFRDAIATLRRAGKRVFIVLEDFAGEARIDRSWKGFFVVALPAPAAPFLEEHKRVREQLTRIANETGAEIIDPYPALCPDGKTCPIVYDDERPVYSDGRHLADRWVRLHATYLDRTLLD